MNQEDIKPSDRLKLIIPLSEGNIILGLDVVKKASVEHLVKDKMSEK